MRIMLDFKGEDVCVKAYDVNTKEVIGTFEGYKKAGLALGIREQSVAQRCKTKTRVFARRLNKEVALRLVRRD